MINIDLNQTRTTISGHNSTALSSNDRALWVRSIKYLNKKEKRLDVDRKLFVTPFLPLGHIVTCHGSLRWIIRIIIWNIIIRTLWKYENEQVIIDWSCFVLLLTAHVTNAQLVTIDVWHRYRFSIVDVLWDNFEKWSDKFQIVLFFSSTFSSIDSLGK